MDRKSWQACDDVGAAIEFLWGRISPRQERLFLAAVTQRTLEFIDSDDCQLALHLAERFLDGQATVQDLRTAVSLVHSELSQSQDARQRLPSHHPERYRVTDLEHALTLAAQLLNDRAHVLSSYQGANAAAWLMAPDNEDWEGRKAETRVQLALLRDIFGDPFAPVIPDPSWRTPAVIEVAHGIHSQGAFDRLPELERALREAGCENTNVLAHCQQVGGHVPGCWVVEMALGHEPPMTADEWETTTDIERMIRSVWPLTTDRKLRLAACGCCRMVPAMRDDDLWWPTLLAAEAYIEGTALTEEQEQRFDHDRYTGGDAGLAWAFGAVSWIRVWHPARTAVEAATFIAYDIGAMTEFNREPVWRTVCDVQRAAVLRVLRCILGNPFRAVQFSAKWRTAEVVTLARLIDSEHAFNRMSELADLLQKAGCQNETVLAHCLDQGPDPSALPKNYPRPLPPAHARGCWLIDAILKQQ